MPRLRLRIGLHQQREAGAFDAVGDPGLGAVDDVVVAVAARRHADALQVGAGVGLGEREPAADLAARKARQPALLLLLGAEFLDRERQHQVRVEDAGDRHPDRRDAHDDLGVDRGGQAEAAVFDADGRAEQAELLHLRDDLGGPAIGVVVLLHDRLDVALEPAIDRREQLRLIGLLEGALAADDVHRGLVPPVVCRRRLARPRDYIRKPAGQSNGRSVNRRRGAERQRPRHAEALSRTKSGKASKHARRRRWRSRGHPSRRAAARRSSG